MFIVPKKVEMARADTIKACGCQTSCPKCSGELKMIAYMAEANIPVGYWGLKMSGFSGAANIKEATVDFISKLEDNYRGGKNLCFAGTLGTGKTYSICNILKASLTKGFSAYYTSLGEMVNYIVDFKTKSAYNEILLKTDFVAIDEVDARHISSTDAAQDFFGATFERILRYRLQNKLPTIIATNNASLDEAFTGQFRKVVGSLNGIQTIVVPSLGKDYRIGRGKND